MASRKRLTKDDVYKIIALKQEGCTMTKVSEVTGFNYRTIRKHWDEDANENTEFIQEYKKVKEESHKELLDLIKGTQYSQITKDAMDLLTKDNLTKEVDNRGIAKLIALIGNSVDKTLAVKEYSLKERAMLIRERELAIKEQELEMRKTNPDAFREVHIYNDAPKEIDERYQN